MRIVRLLLLGFFAACTPDRGGDTTTGGGAAGTAGFGGVAGAAGSSADGSSGATVGGGGGAGGTSGSGGGGGFDATVDVGAGGNAGHPDDAGGAGGSAGTAGSGGAGNAAGAAGAAGSATPGDASSDISLDGDGGDAGSPDVDAGGYVCEDAGPGRAACGCALCGNGQVDMCPIITTGFSGEGCDGLNLGGRTCEGMGYASGQPRCAPNCVVEVFACESCVFSADLSLCRHPFDHLGSSQALSDLALASNGSELSLVWSAHEFYGTVPNLQRAESARIHWARLSADLAVNGESILSPPPPFPASVSSVDGVGLAATSAGWIVAVAVNGHVHIVVVDATGAISSSRDVGEGASPRLVGRDTGGPLLTLTRPATGGDHTQWFTLLGADGTEAVAPVQLFEADSNPQIAGAFVGDGFLVAHSSTAGIRVARIEPNGQFNVVSTVSQSATFINQALAWDGTLARLVYRVNGFPSATYWQSVAPTGTLSGPAVALPFSWVSGIGIVPSSTDSIVLGNRLQTLRLDAAGTVLHGPVTVSKGDSNSGLSFARLGNGLFSAWYDTGGVRYPGGATVTLGSRITVARLIP